MPRRFLPSSAKSGSFSSGQSPAAGRRTITTIIFKTVCKLCWQSKSSVFPALRSSKMRRGDILGRMNLVDSDHERGSAELGYRVGADAAGKGIASQALKLLLTEYIQPLGIREVQAKTTAENIASQKSAAQKRLCFPRDGRCGILALPLDAVAVDSGLFVFILVIWYYM